MVIKKPDIWRDETKKRQEIVQKLAVKYDTIYIRFQDIFDNACKRAPADHWIWDGIHPMPAGHELIAQTWINEVKKKIEFLK